MCLHCKLGDILTTFHSRTLKPQMKSAAEQKSFKAQRFKANRMCS